MDPKAYRFRILNAANDRFFNLQLYEADATGTEVRAERRRGGRAALAADPTVFPTPDTAISPAGPDWIQIGTEGGFLPAPVVIPPQPITWVTDPTVFNAGNVDQHSLLLGPAERADVIVDFSAYAGKTLILYNDAPAAFPARDPRYDYYTGNADLTGHGRRAVDAARLRPEHPHRHADQGGGRARRRRPSTWPRSRRRSRTRRTARACSRRRRTRSSSGRARTTRPTARRSRATARGPASCRSTTTSLDLRHARRHPAARCRSSAKAIQDEMGEAFDKEYGRMSGNLGVEAPNAQAGQQQNLILYPYVNPASEILDGIELPPGVEVTPIATADDGTQIWKITHNGVDTHPIHFHLFDVQLLNRVGWDGIIRKPDANELGWKDTVRISPLEDTIVALRPIVPKIPFGLPDSIRPLNPMMPLGIAGHVQQHGRERGPDRPGDHERGRQLRLGVRVALPHPQPRRDGHDAPGVRRRGPEVGGPADRHVCA